METHVLSCPLVDREQTEAGPASYPLSPDAPLETLGAGGRGIIVLLVELEKVAVQPQPSLSGCVLLVL